MGKNDALLVYVDGGSRGNPGPCAIGVFMTNSRSETIASIAKCIGRATNNIAEYTAVIEALAYLRKQQSILQQYTAIHVFLDSQLVYSQIVGVFKMRSAHLRTLLVAIRSLEASIPLPIYYSHIARERNTQADRLVNLALDKSVKEGIQ